MLFFFEGLPVRPKLMKRALLHLREIHPVVRTVKDIGLLEQDFVAPREDLAQSEVVVDHASFVPIQCNIPYFQQVNGVCAVHPEYLRISTAPVAQVGRPFMESGAHPHLYPTGKFDFSHKRKCRITFGKYVKQRMLQSGSRCAKSIPWIFHMTHLLFLRTLNSQTFMWKRMKSVNSPDVCKSEEMYRFIRRVRGTEPYWHGQLLELLARVSHWGVPTVTLYFFYCVIYFSI